MLKRLDDALRDGDPIRAIIRESRLNQDGKTETITTPSGEAQEALIRECYRRAGLDPGQTAYFEAHGTGTPTGDPIEVAAVASVFRDSMTDEQLLRIGSVKTNIGHTETASGVAAIIKVALALEKAQIPPSINFEKPNAKLRLDEWRIKVCRAIPEFRFFSPRERDKERRTEKKLTLAGWQVPTELESWPEREEGVRLASINNFGYGGSNAHVIMQDLPSFLASSSQNLQNSVSFQTHSNGNGHSNGHRITNGITNGHSNGNAITNGQSNGTNGHANSQGDPHGDLDSNHDSDLSSTRSRVFLLSAKDERATQAMVDNLNQYLVDASTQKGRDEGAFLDNLAYTLGHRRSLFPWRATVGASSIDGLIKSTQSGRAKPTRTGTSPRLGFVYTGQGAQWWAMGRELIDVYPVFKATLLDCNAELKKLGATWNMIGMLCSALLSSS